LNLLLGFGEEIRDELDKEKPNIERLRDLTDMSNRAGQRMNTLIKRLKNFTRRSGSDSTRFSLTVIFENILGLLEKQIRKNSIDVRREYSDELPLITGDITQMEQVVMNLVANAIDAMDNVKDRVLTISSIWNSDKASIEFVIRDSGCGIREEDLKRVFSSFYTTKDRGRGTGLGLTVVNEIVRAHKGEIFVHSTPGKGTEFHVVIPCEEPARSAA
jgi:two-component system NtrC family sensor kinase